jgi:hypothetical protein
MLTKGTLRLLHTGITTGCPLWVKVGLRSGAAFLKEDSSLF